METNWQMEAVACLFDSIDWLAEPQELYQSMAEELVNCVGCDTVTVRMLAAAGDAMIGCATFGGAEAIVREMWPTVSGKIGRMPLLIDHHASILIDFENPEEGDLRVARALDLGYRFAATVPLLADDKLVGVIDFLYSEGQCLDFADLEWLSSLGRILGDVLENTKMGENLLELRASEEMGRIAQEFSENIADSLSVIGLEADKAVMAFDDGDEELLRATLGRLRNVSSIACNVARLEASSLAGSAGVQEDLVDDMRKYLGEFESSWGQHCTFDCEAESLLVSKRVERQILRVLHEAMTNILRHAHAENAKVRMHTNGGLLVMTVEDDGQGFDSESVPPGKLGLSSMRARAGNVGGTLEVRSTVGEGTIVRLEVPMYE